MRLCRDIAAVQHALWSRAGLASRFFGIRQRRFRILGNGSPNIRDAEMRALTRFFLFLSE